MNEAVKKQEERIFKVTQALKNVVGVEAIVLGGSRVLGTASGNSNIDIGVYYLAEGVLDVDLFEQVLTELDDLHRRGILALPGTWGPWLNGGSCIKVDGIVVDISLRSIAKVKEVIAETSKGDIAISYQFGHPFGYVSSMYLAEVDLCKILHEKKRILSDLKRQVRPMNAVYKKASIEHFLWECEYSSKSGRKCADRNDVMYAAGALYKCANSLCQVIYTLNNEYLMNEKCCLTRMATFKMVPKDFINNIKMVFVALDDKNITNAFDVIDYYTNEIRKMIQNG